MRYWTRQVGRWSRLRSTRHLGRRLLILYAITAVAVTAAFSFTLLSSWTDNAALLATVGRNDRLRESGSRLQVAQAEGTARLLDYLLGGDEDVLGAYRAAVAQRGASLQQLGQLTERTAARERVAELQLRFELADKVAERAIARRQTGAPGAAFAGWRAESGWLEDDLTARIAAFIAIQDEAAGRELQRAGQDRGTAVALLCGFAAAGVLGVWITRRVILSITMPLEALAGAAAAIGAGRLETRVAPGLSAEFDMLGTVMNQMAGRLAESRQELQDALAATERRNRELRLLGEVGAALDSSLDLDLILDRSLDVVLALFAPAAPSVIDSGAIVLLNGDERPDDGGLTRRWRGRDGRDPASAARARADDGIAGAVGEVIADPVLGAGQSLVLDLGPGAAAGAALPPALRAGDDRRLVAVPLKAATRVHGALILLTGREWCPDRGDLDLLMQVGGQIARAVENAQLYVAEKQRSAEAGILAQMAQLMSGTLDLDRLARLIARYAVRVLGADRCIVGFYDHRHGLGDRGALQQLYHYGFPPPQAALVESGRATLQDLVQRYTLDSPTLVVPDVHADDRTEVRALAASLDARSFISVPLVARGRQVGLIYLDTRAPRQHPFGQQDQRILAAIADQAAAALEGARLYEAERRRGQQLRLLNEAGRQIALTPQPAELFARVIALIRETFGYSQVAIGLLEGANLHFVAGAGAAWAGIVESGARLPLDGPGLTTVVARTGTPCVVPDVALDARYIGLGGEATRSELVVPLKTRERIIGVLDLQSGRVGAFDADDERVLSSLGDQLGIAVENSRLHERALALAVVDERNRLARELHDSVTQALFSMGLTVEAARLLLRRDPEATDGQLVQLAARTKEALAEMRALIHSLRPAGMEERGLVPALTRWVERVRRENLLPVELAIEGAPRLGEGEEEELFRIVQEALNNVVKHAAATGVWVTLVTTAEAVTLTIEDDGKGFDLARPGRPDAFGTLGMRERAALLGGLLTLDSRPGEGTRVRVTIPHAPHPAPAATATVQARRAARVPAGGGVAAGGERSR